MTHDSWLIQYISESECVITLLYNHYLWVGNPESEWCHQIEFEWLAGQPTMSVSHSLKFWILNLLILCHRWIERHWHRFHGCHLHRCNQICTAIIHYSMSKKTCYDCWLLTLDPECELIRLNLIELDCMLWYGLVINRKTWLDAWLVID